MALPPRQRVEVFALTAPAYLWLAATVFLPLVAMVYFSFLTAVPVGGRTASFTLAHYISFFTKPIYWFNAWRSIELGIYVTAISLLVGYPAALALSRHVKGRWREAIFLLIILPFWSNALVRTFSWTMVLRQPLNLLFTYPAIVIGWCTPIFPMPSSHPTSPFRRSTNRSSRPRAASVRPRCRPSSASSCRSACRAFSPLSS
jgi:spermidine/putrescine transport system permease protein